MRDVFEQKWSWNVGVRVLNYSNRCDSCGEKTNVPYDISSNKETKYTTDIVPGVCLCYTCAKKIALELLDILMDTSV